MKRAWLLYAAALACGHPPPSECDALTACPSGSRCSDGRCVHDPPPADAGTVDAGAADAGAPDAGAPDGGAPDGGGWQLIFSWSSGGGGAAGGVSGGRVGLQAGGDWIAGSASAGGSTVTFGGLGGATW